MSEYKDPMFDERWPLLSRILTITAKAMGIVGAITALVGFTTGVLLEGLPQTSITHANGLTTTTIVQNDFFYSLNFLFPVGILTGLGGFLLWVFAQPFTDRTHLNSETEVEE